MDDTELKQAIKQLLVRECDKADEIEWQAIADDEPLFGNQGQLQLDSLDALQLSLALQQRYGVRIEGPKEGRRILASVDSIVAFIRRQA